MNKIIKNWIRIINLQRFHVCLENFSEKLSLAIQNINPLFVTGKPIRLKIHTNLRLHDYT